MLHDANKIPNESTELRKHSLAWGRKFWVHDPYLPTCHRIEPILCTPMTYIPFMPTFQVLKFLVMP